MNTYIFETDKVILDLSKVTHCRDEEFDGKPTLMIHMVGPWRLRVYGDRNINTFKERFRTYLIQAAKMPVPA